MVPTTRSRWAGLVGQTIVAVQGINQDAPGVPPPTKPHGAEEPRAQGATARVWGKLLPIAVVTALLVGGKPAEAQTTCSATSGIRVGPSDGESLDQLGTSVALSGSTAFLGTPGRVNPDPSLPAFTTTGTVYVARRIGSSWNIAQQMFAPDGANLDKFGKAVALDGTWGIVGAPGDDASAGSAYLYQSNADGSVWSYRQKLLSPTRTAYEYFGQSVAISGSTIVVGAYGNGAYTGKAYVYRWNGSTWTWVQTLTAPGAATYDFFGYSVAVSGNVILVGAYGDDVIGTNSGSVYAYRYNGSTWGYSQTFWPSTVASGDSFGGSCALDGGLAVIGAPVDDSFAGSAYAFRDNGSSFQWEGTLVPSDRKTSDRFGQTVAVAGSGILVGASDWTNNATGKVQQGKAYYFAYDGTAWREKLSLLQTSPWGYTEDHFGSAVALNGGSAVVGAMGEDPPAPTDSGKAYFFDIACTASSGCVTNADCADDGNPCTSEVCSGGACTHPLKAAGTACTTDNNLCTSDTCSSTGVCQYANVATGTLCTDDGNPCTNDLCSSGSCTHPSKPNGTSCSDGNLCNGTETCQSGACTPGTALNCDDGKVCTTDTCNAATGCVHTNNTLLCNDGNACTTGDTCSTGLCVGGPPLNCDDGNACTTDTCNAATGCVHTNNTLACNDGNACTTGDACSNGVCSGTPLNCDDGNACTTDSCSSGICQHVSTTPAGQCCNPSTGGLTAINDNNSCTTDSCNASTGLVTHTALANGTACGSSASTDCDNPDTCSNGTCVVNYDPAGTPCTTDSNACTSDTCNGSGICEHVNTCGCVTSADCNDGNACTTDTCSAGVCQHAAITCNDGNSCTTDSCNPATGCVFTSPACGLADGCCGPTCTSSSDPDCLGLLSAGASCTSNSECYSNRCKSSRGGKKTCR